MSERSIAKSKEFPYSKETPYFARWSLMITSKLTSKSQTTVPKSVRRALSLSPGDLLAYEIDDGRVILTRAKAEPGVEDPFGSFDEWRGREDQDAYAKL